MATAEKVTQIGILLSIKISISLIELIVKCTMLKAKRRIANFLDHRLSFNRPIAVTKLVVDDKIIYPIKYDIPIKYF